MRGAYSVRGDVHGESAAMIERLRSASARVSHIFHVGCNSIVSVASAYTAANGRRGASSTTSALRYLRRLAVPASLPAPASSATEGGNFSSVSKPTTSGRCTCTLPAGGVAQRAQCGGDGAWCGRCRRVPRRPDRGAPAWSARPNRSGRSTGPRDRVHHQPDYCRSQVSMIRETVAAQCFYEPI
jgi:hypothetical protein